MLTLYEHSLLRDLPQLEPHIQNVDTLLDVGAGLRPATWIKPKRHICVEPSPVYVQALRDAGYETIEATAIDGLTVDADMVVLLDVIEHMTKDEGLLAIKRASKYNRVMIYTPHGFVEQTRDKWDCGQEEWQQHRSGWTPDEFPGWAIVEWKEGFAAIKR